MINIRDFYPICVICDCLIYIFALLYIFGVQYIESEIKRFHIWEKMRLSVFTKNTFCVLALTVHGQDT